MLSLALVNYRLDALPCGQNQVAERGLLCFLGLGLQSIVKLRSLVSVLSREQAMAEADFPRLE